MVDISKFWDGPQAKEVYAIAGWEQWADAGSVSSELPEYLIKMLNAEPIGHLQSDGFYLFQLPATHDLMRPRIEFKEGRHRKVQRYANDLYYAGDEEKGLVIFRGVEPHIDVDRYAQGFFRAMSSLGVKRTVSLGGVFGSIPFRMDRNVSCVYSLSRMRSELLEYAVSFSNYKGGASLGSYLAVEAKAQGMEYCTFYSFVPAYDLSQFGLSEQGMRIDVDFRAWYELMRRLNVMFGLQLDLTELEERSHNLTTTLDEKVEKLCKRIGNDDLLRYFEKLEEEYEEQPFLPYQSLLEDELGGILDVFNDDKDLDDDEDEDEDDDENGNGNKGGKAGISL